MHGIFRISEITQFPDNCKFIVRRYGERLSGSQTWFQTTF
ncbi:hypothetical protein NEILACOT_03116 [Neisseria lactamica ATCC 23970]|uniref:Uncharacterized protein n=1 Tax=Neisseria lactamica ATCC 23970 TaxID=546265 RepID=D0W6H8_NEILA|nr:hypothetical protein NEILACOT_03116 [Neisseria lactamica ATCC 23970]